MIRNLLMHVYPHECGKWRRSAAHIMRRAALFNGRKIFTVAIDNTTDSLDDVKAALPIRGAEFLQFQNHALQETVTFFPGMDRLANLRSDEITFRAHAKGSTKADDDATSHPWADLLFATCLDFPELIDEALKDHAIVGPLRTFGLWPFPGMHAWHYAGSFYWFKHDRTFSRDWRRMMPTLFGVEGWPGIFPVDESACLFWDNMANTTARMYSPESWTAEIIPAFNLWRRQMRRRFGRDCWLPEDSRIPQPVLIY